MKAVYDVIMKVKVSHEIDTIEDIKSDREFADDMAQMICDEAVTCNAVAEYEILKSEVNVS